MKWSKLLSSPFLVSSRFLFPLKLIISTFVQTCLKQKGEVHLSTSFHLAEMAGVNLSKEIFMNSRKNALNAQNAPSNFLTHPRTHNKVHKRENCRIDHTLRLTDEQKKEFNDLFSSLFYHSDIANGNEIRSSIARLGVNTCRIMSIIAVLRAFGKPPPLSI